VYTDRLALRPTATALTRKPLAPMHTAMKRTIKILTYILLTIVILNMFSILIFPIPIEFRSRGFENFFDMIFPLSILGLSIILIVNQINSRLKIKYLIIFLGIIGLVVSILLTSLMNFWGEAYYEDKIILYQSLENKNEKIIQQYIDEGALGSNWREVRVKEFCFGIRYSNRFCETTINGLWVKYDRDSGNFDTLKFDNFIYKSELNGGQNWVTKKCK
jgi:hypothetical protein